MRVALLLWTQAELRHLLLSPAARPLRFAGTGSAAGALQIFLFAWLWKHGWEAVLANGVSFLVSAQVNFLLSLHLTWRDRNLPGSLVMRWTLFHISIASMGTLNMLIFASARYFMPVLSASLCGITMAALGNYLMGDRLVFRNGRLHRPSAVGPTRLGNPG